MLCSPPWLSLLRERLTVPLLTPPYTTAVGQAGRADLITLLYLWAMACFLTRATPHSQQRHRVNLFLSLCFLFTSPPTLLCPPPATGFLFWIILVERPKIRVNGRGSHEPSWFRGAAHGLRNLGLPFSFCILFLCDHGDTVRARAGDCSGTGRFQIPALEPTGF